MTETAPEDLWDCDLTTYDGKEKLQALVDEIKKECEQVELEAEYIDIMD